jgi:hypothetical protein
VQLPHDATVRGFPQLSLPLMAPHVAAALAQKSESLSAVQPQTFAPADPPPQVSGALHVPHDRVPPQPSGTEPQLSPCAAHVVGEQPHWLATPPPPHVSPAALHLPQSSVSPQPSEIVPHALPQVAGTQGPWPQMLVPPPPHVSPAALQVPQSSVPPQPSGIEPQFVP